MNIDLECANCEEKHNRYLAHGNAISFRCKKCESWLRFERSATAPYEINGTAKKDF